MSLRKLSYEQLMERLDAVMDQVQVLRTAIKNKTEWNGHPEWEQFKKALPFMINEGNEIMNEMIRRGKQLNKEK